MSPHNAGEIIMPDWQKYRMAAFAGILAVVGLVFVVSGGRPHDFFRHFRWR